MLDSATDITTLLQLSSPYLLVFTLVTVGIWIFPFAEELALASAGYLIYSGQAQWAVMLGVVSSGIVLGDAVLFWLGRFCGLTRISRLRMVRRHASLIKILHRLLDRYGAVVLFCSRFVPGSRFLTHLLVGACGMSVPTYLLTSVLALIIYVPLMVRVAYAFGGEIEDTVALLRTLGHTSWLILAVGIGVWAVLRRWPRRYRARGSDPLRLNNEHRVWPGATARWRG
jgi:membrane protein DedA with SNARE-associated domain